MNLHTHHADRTDQHPSAHQPAARSNPLPAPGAGSGRSATPTDPSSTPSSALRPTCPPHQPRGRGCLDNRRRGQRGVLRDLPGSRCRCWCACTDASAHSGRRRSPSRCSLASSRSRPSGSARRLRDRRLSAAYPDPPEGREPGPDQSEPEPHRRPQRPPLTRRTHVDHAVARREGRRAWSDCVAHPGIGQADPLIEADQHAQLMVTVRLEFLMPSGGARSMRHACRQRISGTVRVAS